MNLSTETIDDAPPMFGNFTRNGAVLAVNASNAASSQREEMQGRGVWSDWYQPAIVAWAIGDICFIVDSRDGRRTGAAA